MAKIATMVAQRLLCYLDWPMDHRKEFQWLVMERLGKEVADNVSWTSPRFLCIAGDFN